MYQDPNQQNPNYPPYYQQNYQEPPPPLNIPVKNRKNWGCIAGSVASLIILASFFICVVASHGSNTSTAAQQSQSSSDITTQMPTKTWTITQTFKGNGSKKTGIFTVDNDWKIQWSCNPSSSFGGSYNMIVAVYNSDGSFNDLGAISSMCQTGSISGETEEHSGGSVYLDITSEGNWTITIQELR